MHMSIYVCMLVDVHIFFSLHQGWPKATSHTLHPLAWIQHVWSQLA